MAQEHLIEVRPDGSIHFLYDDGLMPLMDEGEATVARASHVEPVVGGGWQADMAPVGGPVLGPFDTHAQALTAERKWLEDRNLPDPGGGDIR